MATSPHSKESSRGGDLSSREFPATRGSLVLGLQASRLEDREAALKALCERYWKPIHYYLKRRWSGLDPEGLDLTQAFFVWILGNESLLKRYAPERGGFRAYLKVVLNGFANNENEARNALKRGGGRKTISLDQSAEPLESFIRDPHALSPEEILDQTLKKEILDRARESTRAWYSTAKRSLPFQVYEASVLGPGTKPTDREVAFRFGISESKVGNYKQEVTARIRAAAREEILMTVSDPEELEDEWRAFLRL